MAQVQKANRILTIRDDLVVDYVDRGYNLISKGGGVLREAVPSDIATLQKAYLDHKAEIARLKNELRKKTEAFGGGEEVKEEIKTTTKKKRTTKEG